uniref:HicB-like antitoxin of toxin-antitoxin system domain-containing protein n=1 Tax=Pseudomonas tritici TaxID=2745518 RepID=A0A8H9YU41_9PSED
MFRYSASVSFDNDAGQYEISFRDFENLHSVAFNEDDIELEARDALTAMVGELIDSRIPIPEPTAAQEGEIVIHLPVLTCLKAALHNAMISTGTRKADLARKLNQKGPQIDRLLDVSHASKVETLEQALYLLGYEVSVSVARVN